MIGHRRSGSAHLSVLALLAVLGALALPAAASAQDLYSWTVGVAGGLGGSLDVSPGSRSFDNGSWQIEGLALTEPRTLLGVRFGQLSLGNNQTVFGSKLGADLSYLTLSGQYMYEESYYDSGVYLGIGAYRLSGIDIDTGTSSSRTAVGGVVGLTGEFRATRRLGVTLEVSGHYAELTRSHIFAMAHGGLAFHF